MSKNMYFVCFSRMSHHRAQWWWDIPEISKQDSEKFRRSYKLNKNINYMLYLTNWPLFGVKIVLLVLLARWWDIIKYKNANLKSDKSLGGGLIIFLNCYWVDQLIWSEKIWNFLVSKKYFCNVPPSRMVPILQDWPPRSLRISVSGKQTDGPANI